MWIVDSLTSNATQLQLSEDGSVEMFLRWLWPQRAKAKCQAGCFMVEAVNCVTCRHTHTHSHDGNGKRAGTLRGAFITRFRNSKLSETTSHSLEFRTIQLNISFVSILRYALAFLKWKR